MFERVIDILREERLNIGEVIFQRNLFLENSNPLQPGQKAVITRKC